MHVAGGLQVEPSALVKGQPYEITATFEVFPEVKLVDLTGVDIEKEVSQVEDADVDKMLVKIQHQHAEWEDVARAAQDGDTVEMDFEGFIDDKAFEGGKSEGFKLVLGQGEMIAGFEEGIIGAKLGEPFDLQVTFPEKYNVQDLAGKAATFKVVLHKIQEPKLPEVNDALAVLAGSENIDELKSNIRQRIESELKSALDNQLKVKVLDELLEVNTFSVPDSLVSQEVSHMQKVAIQQMATQQGLQELPDISLPTEPYQKEARKRVALGLLLAEFVKLHDLKVDPDLVREHISDLAASYEKKDEVIQWYYKNPKIMSEIESVVLEGQAVKKLMESANISDKTVSCDSVLFPSNNKEDD